MIRIVVVSASVNSPLEDWDIAERIRDFIDTEFMDVKSVTVTILNDVEVSTFGKRGQLTEEPNDQERTTGESPGSIQ